MTNYIQTEPTVESEPVAESTAEVIEEAKEVCEISLSGCPFMDRNCVSIAKPVAGWHGDISRSPDCIKINFETQTLISNIYQVEPEPEPEPAVESTPEVVDEIKEVRNTFPFLLHLDTT